MAYQGSSEPADQERKLGRAVFGWLVFLILLAVVGLFGYRVWFYYIKIRSGEIVDLPQYSGKLSRSADSGSVSRNVVERSVVEDQDSPALGAENAVLTIVEFADFECPYSREVSASVRRVMARHGDRVRLIYRDLPLESIHVNAFQAAMAAECAREQGQFWQYHDKLYANSPNLSHTDFLRYADELGLDRRQFETCLADNRYKSKVDADAATAKLLGLQGTPTFFFNGQKVEGAIPEDIFEKLVERMVK